MQKNRILLLALFGLILQSTAFAYINPEIHKVGKNPTANYRMDCAQATQQIDLDINNVKARLLNGGDVFWNLDIGRYIVPADGIDGDEVSSIFAAAVWLGGVVKSGDGSVQLKLACQDFRNATTTDFWPGPLSDSDGTTVADTCLAWDRFFTVTGEEIDEHLRNYNAAIASGSSYDGATIPNGVKYWPAIGNPHFEDRYPFELPSAIQGLGNYHDADSNGIYEPLKGDFPVIDIEGCDDPQYPDQMHFWIYNDAGGIHTNTNADAIRMEVQVQAFAYKTKDELNNMTFQRYKLINRAREAIDSTYFAMWVDPDLGCFEDDFIGCDTAASLMYVYNQDELDGQDGGCDCSSNDGTIVPTYCDKVPLLGVDYFRGPTEIQIVNGRPQKVELGMSSFTYYLNGSVGTWPDGMQDPALPQHFYNYLTGRWRDGTQYTYGGSGYAPGGVGTEINYAYTDQPNNVNGWSMCQANLDRMDPRTIQASGPFTLLPGQVNELIVGVVWIPSADYPCPSIDPLLSVDNTAQALFDNCFDILDGPDAPTVCPIEMDKQVILTLVNDPEVSNNAGLKYAERGITIPAGEQDTNFVFEGYTVYQLSEFNEAPDFTNPDEARIVANFDVTNGLTHLYNWVAIDNPFNPSEQIHEPVLRAEGDDEGVKHSILIDRDQFTDAPMINYKEYYFTVIAYGYNNFRQFDPLRPSNGGQKETYVQGRRNTETLTIIPRPVRHIVMNTTYGDSDIEVFGLDGTGVTSNFVDITDEARQQLGSGGVLDEIPFAPGGAPIGVKVYDPVNIQDGEYIVEFEDFDPETTDFNDVQFTVTQTESGEVYNSESGVFVKNEHLINKFGFSIELGQGYAPGSPEVVASNNGLIGTSIEYADSSKPFWFLPQPEGTVAFLNFIRTDGATSRDYALDPAQNYTNENSSGFYPFGLCEYKFDPDIDTANMFGFNLSPGWYDGRKVSLQHIDSLNNVDVVFTSNRELWSKCVIVQSGSERDYGDINQNDEFLSMDLLREPSVTQFDNDGDGFPDVDTEATEDNAIGFAYFPGYAVNPLTGKRLNIFFGENTTFSPDNTSADVAGFPDSLMLGDDRMFNPNNTGFYFPPGTQMISPENVMGGCQHNVYVTNQEYDGCQAIHDILVVERPNSLKWIQKVQAFPYITWVSTVMSNLGTQFMSYADGLIPNDVTVKLRVSQSYDKERISGNNGGHNAYKIIIKDKAKSELTDDDVSDVLDLITVIPNPYYAASEYEINSADTRVKIANLPNECTVSIYSLDGRFIRQYDRNESGSSKGIINAPIPERAANRFIDWDLNNFKGIPVSPGVYYIHIDAPGMGERVIKWFGIGRKFDPSSLN